MNRPVHRIALVTGASRGAGRAIAAVLAERGATVYLTARSAGGASTEGRAETLEQTAALVDARGGRGIPVRCDHARRDQVEALLARIGREQGRLDLLVNNAWGGYEAHGADFTERFWKQDFERRWSGMFEAGVRAHLLTAWTAAPLMIARPGGLIVNTLAWNEGRYLGNLFYDVAKAAISRLTFALAQELRPRKVAAIALAPGFMRTERVVEQVHDPAELATTESPEYLGRAVAALAADPKVLERSGRTLAVADLAREYGFTDVDGRQPPAFRFHWVPCSSCGGTGSKDEAECPECQGLAEVPNLSA